MKLIVTISVLISLASASATLRALGAGLALTAALAATGVSAVCSNNEPIVAYEGENCSQDVKGYFPLVGRWNLQVRE